jgi:hypothetical protein
LRLAWNTPLQVGQQQPEGSQPKSASVHNTLFQVGQQQPGGSQPKKRINQSA